MWSVWQTCRTGRRTAGFLGGLLVALLLAAGPAAGATFSDPMTLSNGGVADTPVVAVTSSGQVYVAWREGDDIWFNRSVETGGSCGGPGGPKFPNPAQNLSNIDPAQAFADSPSMSANDGGGVFIAWREVPRGLFSPAVQSIRFRRSFDGGVTFPESPRSLEFNRFAPITPAVAADNGGGVFVAWQDFGGGKNSVLMAQSVDSGANFNYGNVTANRANSAGQPSMGSDGSRVHLIWREIASSSRGVWYKGFTRGSNLETVGSASATALTTVPVLPFPKLAVSGSQVAAAWFEGGNLQTRTMTDGAFGAAETIYSSTNALSNVSVNLGAAGRFFAWREGDFSIRYRVGTPLAPVEVLRSGSSMDPAVPSVGQAGTDQLVATWREIGQTSTETRLAHTGGSTGGGMMPATVWVTPRVVNYRTMGRGTGEQPNLTVFVELPDGSASDIDLNMLKFNGHSVLPHPSSLADHNGNGIPDLMFKVNRSALEGAAAGATVTAAQPEGTYTVTGNTRSGGCFSGSSQVQIIR